MEILYFFYAGGFGGIAALVFGLLGGITGVLGVKGSNKGLRNTGLVLAVLSLLIGIVGVFMGISSTNAYVEAQRQAGLNPDVAIVVQEIGVMESKTALYWGFIGLAPGLWLWLASRLRKQK